MSRRWVVLAALAFAGCNSTGVGNPAPVKLQLSITRDDDGGAQAGNADAAGGAPADPGAAGAPANGGALGGEASAASAGESAGGAGALDYGEPLPRTAVHDAILVLGELRFLPCDPSEEADAVAVGPFMVDLIHGGTSPTIPEVQVPPGGFCGFEAPLAPATEPARLAGRSVYFDGVRLDGTPFRVYANLQATLRVRARPGMSWNPPPGSKHSVFWALRPRRWVDWDELNSLKATDDGSGNLVIDVERHPLLIRVVRSRLAGSSTLYDDVNADDVFDPLDRETVIGDGLSDAD